MSALEDDDPGSIGDLGATLPRPADSVAMEEVGDVAWELETRSVAEGDTVDVNFVSHWLEDTWEAREDSNRGR